MTLALSFWAGWGVIGVSLAVVLVFYKVIEQTLEAFEQWRDAAPGPGEDLTANEERER